MQCAPSCNGEYWLQSTALYSMMFGCQCLTCFLGFTDSIKNLCRIPWDMWKQKSYTSVDKCNMVTPLMCRFWHNIMPVRGRQRLILNRWQSPKPYNNGCSYFHYCHRMTHTTVGKPLNWVITANILQRTRCTSNYQNGDGCSGWVPLLSIFQVYLLLRTRSHIACCHTQGWHFFLL